MSEILKYFKYKHLPNRLKAISKPFCNMAELLDRTLPEGEEKQMALRKLLESKDCAVRSMV